MTVMETFKTNALADAQRIAAATALPEGITVDSLRATYHAPSRPLYDYSRLTEGQQYIAIPTQLGPVDEYAGSAKSPECNRYHLHVDLYDTKTGAYVCTHTRTWLYECAASFPVGYFTLQILRALSASEISQIQFNEVAALVTIKKSGTYVNLDGWTKRWSPTCHPSGVPHEPTRDDIMAYFQSLSDEDLKAAYKAVKKDPSPVICDTAPKIPPEKEPDEYRYENLAIRPAEDTPTSEESPMEYWDETGHYTEDADGTRHYIEVAKQPVTDPMTDRTHLPADPDEDHYYDWDDSLQRWTLCQRDDPDMDDLPF